MVLPYKFSAYFQTTKYRDEYEKSIKNPSDYWAEAADKLVWFNKWDKVIDTSHPVFTKWLESLFLYYLGIYLIKINCL